MLPSPTRQTTVRASAVIGYNSCVAEMIFSMMPSERRWECKDDERDSVASPIGMASSGHLKY